MMETYRSVAPREAGKLASARLSAALVTAVLATVLAAGVCVASRPADAAFPGGNGVISFVSNRDVGLSETYTMRTDGT